MHVLVGRVGGGRLETLQRARERLRLARGQQALAARACARARSTRARRRGRAPCRPEASARRRAGPDRVRLPDGPTRAGRPTARSRAPRPLHELLRHGSRPRMTAAGRRARRGPSRCPARGRPAGSCRRRRSCRRPPAGRRLERAGDGHRVAGRRAQDQQVAGGLDAAHEAQHLAQARGRIDGLLGGQRVDHVAAAAHAHGAEPIEVARDGRLGDVDVLGREQVDELPLATSPRSGRGWRR